MSGWKNKCYALNRRIPTYFDDLGGWPKETLYEENLRRLHDMLIKDGKTEKDIQVYYKNFKAVFNYDTHGGGHFDVNIGFTHHDPEVRRAMRKDRGALASANVIFVVLRLVRTDMSKVIDDVEDELLFLSGSLSHYEVEQAVWRKLKDIVPNYSQFIFENASIAHLMVVDGMKNYTWFCPLP